MSIKSNNSYILNPNFPSAYKTPGTCTYYINKEEPNICVARLDMVQMVLTNPDGDGLCNEKDYLEISTPSGYVTPKLCGKNSDYHMYVDIGPVPTDNLVIMFTLVGTQQNRYWEILVKQYTCGSNLVPIVGCMQYFTGISGLFESYNWENSDAFFHLANMDYSICFRDQSSSNIRH
ncbi:uncharacterized protein LOC111695066 [Eurytemora carolleeae]|uniref:uncharacterized protein LOC111695066 n=1 Tax=Eurytemora carolleeae TaxID=1294199 RepID=UPI000C791D82|nr:uncharacterized protein LOC111695066 [Eurytemora carolleeae]|eukprot:XP_023319997.1 uncharacterized protein LOC111695066 [Eurytemora affinis]